MVENNTQTKHIRLFDGYILPTVWGLKQLEYTGANHCLQRTIVNGLIALVVSGLIAGGMDSAALVTLVAVFVMLLSVVLD